MLKFWWLQRIDIKSMTLYISTGDEVVGYGAVYLFWRRCGILPHFRSVLGTFK